MKSNTVASSAVTLRSPSDFRAAGDVVSLVMVGAGITNFIQGAGLMGAAAAVDKLNSALTGVVTAPSSPFYFGAAMAGFGLVLMIGGVHRLAKSFKNDGPKSAYTAG